MADINSFFTHLQDDRLSLSELKRAAFHWTIPFFPDDWTLGKNNTVLFVTLILAFVCSGLVNFRLYQLESQDPQRKKKVVNAVGVITGLIIGVCLSGMIRIQPTTYLVQTTEPSLVSGFYAFDVMGETADTYEIPVLKDYQLTEDGFKAPLTITLSQSDVSIQPVFEYDDEDTTLGDYRTFTKTLKDAVLDRQ